MKRPHAWAVIEEGEVMKETKTKREALDNFQLRNELFGFKPTREIKPLFKGERHAQPRI